jgi:hypothetical protein
MIVLGISGSPREGGNTDILLERALSGAKSKGAFVEKIVLNNLNFSPCQECNNVREDGVCTVKDDMQTVYTKVENAGAIILTSPIFFGSHRLYQSRECGSNHSNIPHILRQSQCADENDDRPVSMSVAFRVCLQDPRN